MTKTPPSTTPVMAAIASARRPSSQPRTRATTASSCDADPEPDRARARARDDQPQAAGDDGDAEQRGPRAPHRPQREADEADREHGARERGEVVVAEERRLPPPGRPRFEDVRAEDLRHPGHRGNHRPGDERADDDLGVAPRAHEERHGERQQRVLGELRRRDDMRDGVVARGPAASGRRCPQHVQQEDPAGDPDRPAGAERSRSPRRMPATSAVIPTASSTRSESTTCSAGRPRVHGEAGLVVDVQEQDRQRRGQHDRRRQRHARGPPGRAGARLVRSDGHGAATILAALARLPLVWRRSAAAAGIYLSVGFGFLATVLTKRQLRYRALRSSSDRDRQRGLLPDPARPHRRGGARQVRLRLLDGGATGAGCGGCFGPRW